jgi:isopentenyl-diphosphate delta-isomerase
MDIEKFTPVNDRNSEPSDQFERRKGDHIRLSLDARVQAEGLSGFEDITLIHEALPELNFEEVELFCSSLGQRIPTPFLVSSMTAGHAGSTDLNARLALACEARGWRMGVGSQRRELTDINASREWKNVRKLAPKVQLLGNLGLSQLIATPLEQVQKLAEDLEASAMIIHLNALQECLQPEGTPQFKGGLKALKKLTKFLSIPVIVKETGCGFSKNTLERLQDTGVAAVDVSGLGGTHWGRIEGFRNPELKSVADTFSTWGISTVESVTSAIALKPKYEVWASGGVRSGLDAAKLLALGARTVGVAKPILEAALQDPEALDRRMQLIEQELKIAMFCTGSATISDLRKKKVWKWQKNHQAK